MRYFFLKIGPGNSFAPPLLQHLVLDRPVVAGFFRGVTLEEIALHAEDERVRFSRQAVDLYHWASGRLDGYAVTVAAGRVWVMEPVGAMEEMSREEFETAVGPCPHTDDIPKLVPVRVVAEERLTHVPTLLAQITANRHLSSSTFKEIRDDFGNRLALDHVLFKHGLIDTYPTVHDGAKDLYHLLLCLGANELVALTARLLEEQGLSVPAPTGGFVKNVDLFAYNDRPEERVVGSAAFGRITVPPRRAFRHGAVMIQVRGVAADTRPVPGEEVDYVIQLNAEPAAGVMNHSWIGAVLTQSPATRQWLERVVRWVPFSGTVLRALSSSPSWSD